MLFALMACRGPEWGDEQTWDGQLILLDGAPEHGIAYAIRLGVNVNDDVVDDTDDGFSDDATEVQLRTEIEARITGPATVRVLRWGELDSALVEPAEDLEIGTDERWRDDTDWLDCSPPCSVERELRFDLRDGDASSVEIDMRVRARATDEDNPIRGGRLVLDVEPF